MLSFKTGSEAQAQVRLSRLAPVVLLAAVVLQAGTHAQTLAFSVFERYLESLYQQAGIPGLSAAIVQSRRIVWERGFGLQNVESSIAATPDTPYPVGDITQTFAATLLLQCAERGLLSLDAPMRQYTGLIPEPVSVRAVLAHASPDALGRFRYDPARYAALTTVVDDCGAVPYRERLVEEILNRLGMFDSVPGDDLADPTEILRDMFDAAALDRYAAVLRRRAVPYKVSRGKPTRVDYVPTSIDASTGLTSTVRDLARYDAALDDGILLRPDTLAQAWTNAVSSSGVVLPSGLGWLVQSYEGQRVVWHFGLTPDSFSSLIVKVPGRDVTLILLANSDGLSAPFPLREGDVTSSVFAKLFLRLFA